MTDISVIELVELLEKVHHITLAQKKPMDKQSSDTGRSEAGAGRGRLPALIFAILAFIRLQWHHHSSHRRLLRDRHFRLDRPASAGSRDIAVCNRDPDRCLQSATLALVFRDFQQPDRARGPLVLAALGGITVLIGTTLYIHLQQGLVESVGLLALLAPPPCGAGRSIASSAL